MEKRLPGRPDPAKFPQTLLEKREKILSYIDVTCKRSAELRGVPPSQELKSIVFHLDDNKGQSQKPSYALAHVPGDRMVSEVALASIVGQVRLAPIIDIWGLNLEKGRVNPFTAALYIEEANEGFPVHVVCVSVFKNKWVHTNNDHIGGWIEFRPQEILHWVENVVVAGQISEYGEET